MNNTRVRHMSDEPAIEASGLAKSYGGVRVLRGIDLRVPRGSVFALLGPNGAGKTTAVRILATLSRADAGQARVAGFDVGRDRRQVRRHISLTGQFAALDAAQTGVVGHLVRIGHQRAPERGGGAGAAGRQQLVAPAAGFSGQCHARAGVTGHVGHAPCGLGTGDAVLVGGTREDAAEPAARGHVPPTRTIWFQAVSPM